MRQMCILEKLNFKTSWASMPPDPPSVPVPSVLDPILAGATLNFFRRAWSQQSHGQLYALLTHESFEPPAPLLGDTGHSPNTLQGHPNKLFRFPSPDRPTFFQSSI